MIAFGDGLACGALNTVPSEVAFLQTEIGNLSFLYSRLGTVNVTGTLVDSVVDRLGLGPNLVAATTVRPTWDPDLKTITGDGIDDRLAPAAAHAVFNFATLRWIATVAVVPAGDTNRVISAVCESLSANRDMEILGGATNVTVSFSAPGVAIDTAVAKSTNRRVVVAFHDASTTGTGRVLNHAAVNGVITALASGDNRLTIFDYFPAGGANAVGPWCATVGGTAALTAGHITALATWGTTYHGAALAA